jgi:hypothetical protein
MMIIGADHHAAFNKLRLWMLKLASWMSCDWAP